MPRSRPPLRFAAGLLAGLVLSGPLAIAGSFVGSAATRHLAEAPPAGLAPVESQMAVNRDAKSARLPLPVSRAGAPAIIDTIGGAATSVVRKGEVARDQAPRAMKPRGGPPPKGCLSAIGGLGSSAATEETTVCLADISMIKD